MEEIKELIAPQQIGTTTETETFLLFCASISTFSGSYGVLRLLYSSHSNYNFAMAFFSNFSILFVDVSKKGVLEYCLDNTLISIVINQSFPIRITPLLLPEKHFLLL